MFSPTRTLTACKLLLPFLICLHPTRVIAIYTRPHTPPPWVTGDVSQTLLLYDNVGHLLQLHGGLTQYIYFEVYVCHSSIVLYISRLSNVLPYPHLNSLLGLLAILDTSISYPCTCYLHTYHIPPLLGHWGRIIDVLYDNVGDLLLLNSYYYIVARPNIYLCITPVFSSTSRMFNVLSYPHVYSRADYEMPHFRAIL